MKISVKLQEQQESNHHPPPLLLRAKIPISIFNLPLLSHFSTTTSHPSDLTLSLSTHSPSFPSLKLSYATSTSTAPLTLTLKSGAGLFGSPNNSPIAISAHFSFNPCNPSHPNPTFSLFFKPKLGSFSLRKSTFSHPEPSSGFDPNSFEFVPPANALEKNNKNSILKGFQLAARTKMAVSKRVALNFGWWVKFENEMPVLRMSKIGLDGSIEKNEGKAEVLKGMCSWMKREVDVLTRVNREMKCELQEMKKKAMPTEENDNGKRQVKKKAMPCVESEENGQVKKKVMPSVETCSDNGKRQEKKKSNFAIDVENELQRAIKAAASTQAVS